MARVTVEDCLEQVENRFALVLLAAQRTRQLMKGEEALLESADDNKEAVTALREIAQGLITLDDMTRIRAENDAADAAERAALAENAAHARAAALARLQAGGGPAAPAQPPTPSAEALFDD
jgi:DNA-directed RNA polymerase subunit omega